MREDGKKRTKGEERRGERGQNMTRQYKTAEVGEKWRCVKRIRRE